MFIVGGIFDDQLPAVITIDDGEAFGARDIAVKTDVLLVAGSQFVITLTSVQLHTS